MAQGEIVALCRLSGENKGWIKQGEPWSFCPAIVESKVPVVVITALAGSDPTQNAGEDCQ